MPDLFSQIFIISKLNERSISSLSFPRYYIKTSSKNSPSFECYAKSSKIVDVWKGFIVITSNSFLDEEPGLPQTVLTLVPSSDSNNIQKKLESLYTNDEESCQALNRLLTISEKIVFFLV